MKRETKKPNPYTKRIKIQARVDQEEFMLVETKARLYTNGDIAKYIRMACLNYKKR